MNPEPESLEEIRRSHMAEQGIPESSVPTLFMPPQEALLPGAKIIYLDLNQWIYLAQARLGRDIARETRPVYEELLRATAAGEVSIVLSAAVYEEMLLNRKYTEQRNYLADVISELSRFRSIRPRSQLLEIQFEQALHTAFGSPLPPTSPEIFGIGVMWAYQGESKQLALAGPPHALAAFFSEAMRDETEKMIYQAQELMEFAMLRGPRPEDEATMPDYDLGPIRQVETDVVAADRSVLDELAKDASLKPRLSDILVARELLTAVGSELPRLMAKSGLRDEDLFTHDKVWLTDFVLSIPILAVQHALRFQTLGANNRPWIVNDLRDAHHLSVSVPYCDIVVTDNDAAHALRRAKLDERFGTTILTKLSDLPAALQI